MFWPVLSGQPEAPSGLVMKRSARADKRDDHRLVRRRRDQSSPAKGIDPAASSLPRTARRTRVDDDSDGCAARAVRARRGGACAPAVPVPISTSTSDAAASAGAAADAVAAKASDVEPTIPEDWSSTRAAAHLEQRVSALVPVDLRIKRPEGREHDPITTYPASSASARSDTAAKQAASAAAPPAAAARGGVRAGLTLVLYIVIAAAAGAAAWCRDVGDGTVETSAIERLVREGESVRDTPDNSTQNPGVVAAEPRAAALLSCGASPLIAV